MLSIHIARFLGKPVKPIAKDKKVEPAKINAIMQEVLVAPSREDLNVSNVKLFENKIRLMLQEPREVLQWQLYPSIN